MSRPPPPRDHTEHNWFWQQGFHDGLNGVRAFALDEVRYLFQRSDYFAGYDAGSEARSAAHVDLRCNEYVTSSCELSHWISDVETDT